MNKSVVQSPENKENQPSSTFVPPPTPLLKKIGFGTGVSVYHLDRSPCNHALRSPWALKTVNRQHAASHFQERLETEAKILQELKHPNIVGFRGFTKTKDGRKNLHLLLQIFKAHGKNEVLAMEECTESLGDIIERMEAKGAVRFEPAKILTVIAEVSKALQYLHEEKGLLHGDLKSFNVLIKGDFEEVKLCDFGVSLDLKSATVDDYIGTGAWSAPETLEDGDLTEKADIFSLGLIVWEMLMLKFPHVADDCNDTSFSGSFDSSTVEYEQHYGETPALPEGLPSRYKLVTDIYEWCTQQDWERRPRARDILDKLAQNGIPLTRDPPQITI